MNFKVVESSFAEDLDKSNYVKASDYCLATALMKSSAIANNQGLIGKDDKLGTILICADTIVEINQQILEKPVDREDAKKMLSMLSNSYHLVHTAVTISSDRKGTQAISPVTSFVQTTKVKFIELTALDIEAYVDSGEPFDKAGSYGIQGIGGQFVEGIEGCYFNVMGLPIGTLSRRLCELYKVGDI